MSLVSIRLPVDVEERLVREAERTRRAKSEIARDAIVEHLDRMERDRFLGEIARAARVCGDDAIHAVDDALTLDNEALSIAEGEVGIAESPGKDRKRKKRRS